MISKATIKYIQNLQLKKYRDAGDVFVAEGTVMLQEMLLEDHFELEQVYATAEWLDVLPGQLKEQVNNFLQAISSDELKKISGRPSPVGALAVLHKKKDALPVLLPGEVYLVLDNLQDPGNLGTIIRTADWYGVRHIICSEDTANNYNPKVVQSTMASLGRVKISYTSLVPWLMEQSAIVYAATLQGDYQWSIDPTQPTILIIGNEANGISVEVRAMATKRISIQRRGQAESLNAAVATGILLDRIFA